MIFFPAVLLVIAFDQWARREVRARTFLEDFPWVRFELHWNEGFFGGNHSELSPLVNQVFLSSMSLIIIALLSLFGFLYRKDKIRGLGKGLWLFGLGLSVNVLDRIFLGRVTDWVILKWGVFENYAFNLADLLIGSGLLILCYLLTFESRKFWQDSTTREKILVEKKFQFRMAFFLVASVAAVALLLVLSTLIFFRLFLIEPTAPIQIYGWLVVATLLLWIIIGWWAGLQYSRDLFGPILALENLIERALRGKCTSRDHAFHLRKSDSFQNLGVLGREIAAKSLSNNSGEPNP